VVSDGKTHTGYDRTVEETARRFATVIQDLSEVQTRTFQLGIDEDLSRFRASLNSGGPNFSAMVVTHTDPDRTRLAQSASTGPPVVTVQDALAITLTAAVLTTLSRSRRPTQVGRVVIAGASGMPSLSPLLVGAEAGEVTVWNTRDAGAFPLRRITADADVVVNLIGDDLPAIPASDGRLGPTVLTPDPDRDPLLVLPGLVQALIDSPWSELDGARDEDLYYDVCHECALALVLATPPHQRHPSGPSRDLSARIAKAATRALQPPGREAARPEPGNS
jgi:malate dehydrogenase (oxaloacetate-decarboxylating)